jgi:hypothetical protein
MVKPLVSQRSGPPSFAGSACTFFTNAWPAPSEYSNAA